ncbi:MAG TPA: SAF domain-containing protein [bacterium]|nr:SAF domain-containing protein [bacterium]
MSLRRRLQERARTLGPIRVGLVGAGQMGTGLVCQMERMDGMRIVATADVVSGRAASAYGESGVPVSHVVSMDDDVERAAELIQEGKRIATAHADWLVRIPALDVIVECTGVPEVGAQVCLAAIEAGKSIVNMNVEADATVGYRLAQLALDKNVVYTLIGGDEPGAIKQLYDFADVLGFEIVAIGKGKNNPLDRTANPETVRAQAIEQMMSPKMLASFVDGTKTMVEMTAVGNATGFAPEVPGGYGPQCTVDDLPRVFVPRSAGGILCAPGAVDYAIGPAPGVFVVITTDQPKIIRDLDYLHLRGHGRHWVLYRPYHLANLEAPITIADAVLDRKVTLATYRPPVCETVACAKRDLRPGDKIDALGGYTVYGLIERAQTSSAEGMVPVGLIVGATVERPVKANEPIRFPDVALDETQSIVRLRREQDRALLTVS